MLVAACSDQPVQRQETTVSPAATVISTMNAVAPRQVSFTAYLTGYTYWDNTPRGSTAIARPVVHRRAGGIGTWTDPVTIAVGHRIEGGRQTLDFPEGTRFYLPNLRKYAIVEDVCGDGHQPQNGPCHSGYEGHPWLDIWIGGRKVSSSVANACAHRITALQMVVLHPRQDLLVEPGEIVASGCRVF